MEISGAAAAVVSARGKNQCLSVSGNTAETAISQKRKKIVISLLMKINGC